jgi:membrane complex biogenesis BtpA family protein
VLGAPGVKILADVDVKHSAALAPRPLKDEIEDTIQRGLADAVIVSGAGTGKATDPGKIRDAKLAAGTTPVFVGSGVTVETVGAMLAHADGFIVGTSLKKGGVASNPVDAARVREFMAAVG